MIAAVLGTEQEVITPPTCLFVGCERAVAANAMVRIAEDNILTMKNGMKVSKGKDGRKNENRLGFYVSGQAHRFLLDADELRHTRR